LQEIIIMGQWQFNLFSILYALAFVLTLVLFFLVLKVKHIKGRLYFAYMIISISLWILGFTLGFFNESFKIKLIMLRVEYFGIIATSLLWLFFVSAYTNSDKWLTLKVKLLLLIVPVLTFIQLLFVRKHELFYIYYGLSRDNGLVVTEKVYAPGFYIWVLYSYLLVLSGIYILIRALVKMPQQLRGQIIPHIMVVAIILIPNAFYISGNNPIAPYDPICLSFVVMAFIYIYIMNRHGFLDIAPVAHYLLFQNVKSGVLVVNNRNLVVEANPAVEEILSKTSKELVGSHLDQLAPVLSDLAPILKEKKEIKREIEFNDPHRIYELQTNIMNDSKGRALGLILMFYDITQRKQALDELDAYARTVAHNLKNPMTSMAGFAELLADNNDFSEEEIKEYLEMIRISAHKMSSIIDGLLLLSQIREKKEIKKVPIDMGEIVNQVLSRLNEQFDQSHAQINYPGIWPVALGYPLWVEEIWVNYITNALKYGGPRPDIILGAEEYSGHVRFWVKDSGGGIDENDQKMLFQEFTRLGNTNSTDGFGLGLSIVKRIVNKMGGQYGVESKPGEGSLFYFTLPTVK
jgi:PAS domain S-box-containing protein